MKTEGVKGLCWEPRGPASTLRVKVSRASEARVRNPQEDWSPSGRARDVVSKHLQEESWKGYLSDPEKLHRQLPHSAFQ